MNTNNKGSETWLQRKITLHSNDSRKEHLASSAVHGLGALAALIAIVPLILRGVERGAPGGAAGYAVFGLSMFVLYISSSLYHLVKVSDLKRVLRIADHMSIYLLIAGTYTPIMITVGGFWGNLTLVLVWGLAAAGMVFKIIFWGRLRILHVLIYIAMGWLILLVWKPVSVSLNGPFLAWTLAGGVTYTAGTLVYAMKKVPFYHALWHLFVLAGSACLFVAVYVFL